MLNENIITERFTLQPINKSCKAIWTRVYSDEKTMSKLGGPLSVESAGALFEKALSAAPSSSYFVITETVTGQLVGLHGLVDSGLGEKCREAGTLILADHRHQGCATEVMTATISILFRENSAKSVVAKYKTGHKAARQLLRALAFESCAPFDVTADSSQYEHFKLSRTKWLQSVG